ncbi:MAG: glycosyltransferase [bacterium]
MSKFLIACWSFPGHVRPCLVLARALRERGHTVAFYTGSRGGAAVREEGFPHFPFEQVDEDALYARLFPKNGASADARHPLRFIRTLRAWTLATVPGQVSDLANLLARWTPDVLVTDVTMWAPFLVLADRLPTPVAVLAFAPGCMIPHREVPPWGLGLEPSHLPWKQIHYRVAAALHRRTAESFRKTANRLRRRYGLPGIDVPVNAYAARAALYLVPSARELDDPRSDLPGSVHYIGALAERKPAGDARLPAWFASLRPGWPRVHVTEGTVSFREPFLLKAAVEAFRGEPVEVILTTCREQAPRFLDPRELPPNVHAETFLPHEALLPEIDCLVTTGGAGTVLTALEHGVPMVVVPTEWDKPDNARHVRKIGAGVVLSPKRCKASALRKSVAGVLAGPSYREAARRMGSVLRAYRGAERGAELLEELSSRGVSGP